MKSEVTENLMCEFNDAIVPYLYGESSEAERDRFEMHMADCTPCTDEFAGLSFSRYSVFEWQKEEFAPMPTPQIVIPYEAKAVESVGLFAGLRELLTFNWPSVVGSAAAIAIIAGLGFVALNYFDQPIEQVAAVNETNTNAVLIRPVSSPNPTIETAKVVAVTKPNAPIETPQITKASVTQRRRVVTTANNNVPRKLANDDAVNIPPRQDRKAPALTADTDEDDKSLRLADLFDTVDTRL